MTVQSDMLREKTDAARRQAYEEELVRLEKEISFGAREALHRWIAEVETSEREQLERAAQERESQQRNLRNREQELFRQLEEEERRKRDELRRRREEDERRKRDEDERRKKKENEERLRNEAAFPTGPSKEEIERLEKSRKLLLVAESLLQEGNFEAALAEVSKALGLVPIFPDALGLQERIRQAQRTMREATGDSPAAETPEPLPVRRFSLRILVVLAACLLLVLASAYLFTHRRSLFPQTGTIVVLPFTGITADPLSATLADALPVEIGNHLQYVQHLRVMAGSSAQMIGRRCADPLRVAGRLGFANIVSGTVIVNGGSIAVTMIVSDSTGRTRWSHTYQNLENDNGSFVRQMAVDLLAAAGFGAQRSELDTYDDTFTSPSVFQSYLRGVALMVRGRAEYLPGALEAFLNAAGDEPPPAKAFIGAAEVSLALAQRDHSSQYLALAEQYLGKAAASGSPAPEWLIARAATRLLRNDFPSAVAALDSAAKLLPLSPALSLQKARIALEIGRYDESIAMSRRALDLDPRNPAILEHIGIAMSLNGSARDDSACIELGVQAAIDSVAFLTGSAADVIMYDPDLQSAFGKRVAAACAVMLSRNPNDFETMYRLARLQQVAGNLNNWNPLLLHIKAAAEQRLRSAPLDPANLILLARALTRLGQFPEADRYAQQALAAGKGNPDIFYKAAQMYCVQMFSVKKNQIDSVKKQLALHALRDAIALDYRIPEMANADFYNFHGEADFRKVIQLPYR